MWNGGRRRLLRELRTRRLARLDPPQRGHYELGRGSVPSDARTRRMLTEAARMMRRSDEMLGKEGAGGETPRSISRRDTAFFSGAGGGYYR